eukprot:5097817-Lingulodinium_polyedra.AAC.1
MAPLEREESGARLREMYRRAWKRVFWAPRHVRCDAGGANVAAEMREGFERDGASLVDESAGEAREQTGLVEVHGRWFSEILERVVRQAGPSNRA